MNAVTFDFELVPKAPGRATYFVKDGPRCDRTRGFKNREDVARWFDRMRETNALDWRVGDSFRIRGYAADLQIVRRTTNAAYHPCK